MAEGTKWSTILAYNYGNSRSLFCAALVYSRAQHPPALERAGLNRGNNKPVFAMWVLNEGGDPVS